ncbi:hypothetical protein WG899_10650 [Paucibacter sp. AS339]|uniref:hypothetical protein n=1 Tax=Paucibacter hankyongi TaxID=3133434 RepID=UPI0030ADC5CE
MPQNFLASSTRTLLPCLLLAGCLIGCAGPRHAKTPYAPRQDLAAAQERAEALAAGGYTAEAPTSLTLSLQQWVLKGESVPVSLAFPSSGRGVPLLVYLPGLGESAQAGAHWRHAWARAGYAVLSLQALETDAQAWSSPLARSAEFKALALQHQQPGLRTERLRLLAHALQEARARAKAGDSLWSRVDFERMALAGYDLGADTALAWADAASDGSAQALPRPQALILLSPQMPPPESSVADSPAPPGLRLPLLAISSRRDTDPTGLIGSPAQRIAFFSRLTASGDKYLLLLNSSSHAALAGASGMEEAPNEPTSGRGMSGGNAGNASRGNRGGNSSGGNSRGGGMQDHRGNGQMAPAPAPLLRDNGNQEAGVAIEHSSIAFLDAHVRGRPEAQRWLQLRPSVWLASLAEWRLR